MKLKKTAWCGCQCGDGRHAPRDARDLSARDGSAGIASGVSRFGRFGQPVCGAVRHGVGHHERVPRAGECRAGDAGACRAGHRRGAGGDRDGPCSRRYRRWLPTTATRMTSIAWPRASKVSPKSFPTSCNASHAGSGGFAPQFLRERASRSNNRLMNEINVVPYIDVMLVLLVIFMVTAPLMNPGQVDLPQVGKSLAPPVAPLEVIIKKMTRWRCATMPGATRKAACRATSWSRF